MTRTVSIYAIFASDGEARRIARILIEERLAACANILGPCRSIYRWLGKVEEAEEVAAIFKTASARAEAAVARIVELHGYEVPAVAVWPIDKAPAAYAAWVEAESSP